MAAQHYAQAEAAVRDGLGHIARQRIIIRELERGGHDARSAKQLLATYLELQVQHEEHRDRLKRELAQQERAGQSPTDIA